MEVPRRRAPHGGGGRRRAQGEARAAAAPCRRSTRRPARCWREPSPSTSSSSPACPAPGAPPPPSAWRTSAGSSSTTCRRPCSRPWSTSGRRPAATVDRIAVVTDVRSRAFTSDLRTAARGDRAGSACRRGCCSSRRPTRRWSGASTASAGRTRCRATGRLVDGIAEERELLRDLRGEADLVLDTTALNVHELRAKVVAAFSAPRRRGRAAADGAVVRLQVRPAGRRRPRARLPLPAQPALGARAAAADRPGRGRPRLRAGAGRARRSSSTGRRACCGCCSRATCARASATRCSRSAAPAASTAAWR